MGCWRFGELVGLVLIGVGILPADWRDNPPLNRSVAAADLAAPLQFVTRVEAVPASVDRLRKIEESTLAPPLVPGPEAHQGIPEYYWSANPALLCRLEDARQAYRDGDQHYQALTLVAGAAGVGKTFLKGQAFAKDFPKQAVCKVDLHELYEAWSEQQITAGKADLHCGEIALNRLYSVTNKETPYVYDHLRSKDAQFYVVDSLDEVHSDDYLWILEQIEQLAFQNQPSLVHVVVFGRGPAFVDYWRRHDTVTDDRNIQLVALEPPCLKTLGDWMVSSWNYHSWRYKLAWTPAGDQMPLGAYARWVDSGFSRDGEFQTVTATANQSMRRDVHATSTQWLRSHRVLASTIGNLAGNSMIREVVEREILAQHPYDEQQIMEAYLRTWMIRDTKAGDRPSEEKPEYLQLYLTLLQHVAVKYLQEDRIDDAGYFPVDRRDTIVVDHQGQELAFSAETVLNHSGLISVDPREQSPVTKYRFAPIWFHRLLVEMHNREVSDQQQLARRAIGP